MRFRYVCLLALVCAAPPVLAAEANSNAFETRLSPSPLTDGTRVNIAGEGHVSAQLDGRKLNISGDFHGLASNATTAELYNGPGIAIPGTKAFDLTVTPAMAGSLSGNVALTVQEVKALRAGHFYVQINSQKAPDGNLTGWLLPPHPFAGEDVPVAGPGFLPQFDVPGK